MISQSIFMGGGTHKALWVGNYNLVIGSARVQRVTPGAGSGAIYLPAATKLRIGGPQFYICNSSATFSVVVKDNGGNTIVTLATKKSCIFMVVNNDDDDGLWQISKQYVTNT